MSSNQKHRNVRWIDEFFNPREIQKISSTPSDEESHNASSETTSTSSRVELDVTEQPDSLLITTASHIRKIYQPTQTLTCWPKTNYTKMKQGERFSKENGANATSLSFLPVVFMDWKENSVTRTWWITSGLDILFLMTLFAVLTTSFLEKKVRVTKQGHFHPGLKGLQTSLT